VRATSAGTPIERSWCVTTADRHGLPPVLPIHTPNWKTETKELPSIESQGESTVSIGMRIVANSLSADGDAESGYCGHSATDRETGSADRDDGAAAGR
jgi:hypothetical protein